MEVPVWAPAAPRSLRQRALAPLTAGGLRQSVFTLVQTALGGGVLTMAYMMRLSGLGTATLLLVLAALVAFTGMEILMRSAVELKIFTFSGLMIRCLGPRSGPLLDLMLVGFGNGALVAFFIFLGDFLPDLIVHVNDGPPGFCEPQNLRGACLVACCVLAVPMALPKNISALRHVSPFALGGLFYTVLVVLWQAPALYSLHIGTPGFGEITWFTWDASTMCRSFSICIFAFNCHLNVVPVASELVNPTSARLGKTVFRVVFVQFLVYLAIAGGGYLSFLAATPQSLITGYPGADRAILCSRALLSVTLLACIPMNGHPTVRSLMLLLEAGFPGLRESSGNGEPLLPTGPEKREGAKVFPYPADREGLRHLLTVVSVATDCWMAMNFTEVATIIGYLGASVGTMMMMVIPVLLLVVAVPDLYPPVWKWLIVVFLMASATASVSSMFI